MRRPTLIEILLALLVLACFLIAAGIWRAVPARDAVVPTPVASPPPWRGTRLSPPREDAPAAAPVPTPPPYGVTAPPAGTGTAPAR